MKCKDRPPQMKNYALHFRRDSETKLGGADYSSLIKIEGSFINVTNDYVLLSNSTIINSSFPRMTIGILFDESITCRYAPQRFDNFDSYPEQELSCNGKYCEHQFDVSDRSIYIGCINKINDQRNINDNSLVIDLVSQ